MMKLIETSEELGLQIIPLIVGEKKPAVRGWNKKSFDLETLRSYDLNHIGLRMGDQGFFTLDVDAKNSSDPDRLREAVRSKLFEAGIDEQFFIHQHTVNNGDHYVFRFTSNSPISTHDPNWVGEDLLKTSRLSSEEKGVILETRGKGGFIKVYEPENFERIGDIQPLDESMMNTLYTIATSFDTGKNELGVGKQYVKTKDTIESLYKRYNKEQSCLDLVLERGWQEVGTDSDGNIMLLRDGEPTSNKSANFFPDSNRLYVFSTNTGLPEEEALSSSDIRLAWDFNNDTKAFYKVLKEKYSQDEWHTVDYNEYGLDATATNGFIFQPLVSIIEENKDKPDARMLAGEMWREGEINIFFAPQNVGKSLLAVQIGVAIAKGESEFSDYFKVETPPQKVIYLDLELSRRQLTKRYRESGLEDKSFIIANIDINGNNKGRLIDRFFDALKGHNDAKVVIIDNLSALDPDLENAKEATELIQKVKRYASGKGISVMLISHTPKLAGGELKMQSLKGSSQLGNLVDSCFAIADTKFRNRVYLKQLKSRDNEKVYIEDNVLVMERKSEKGLQMIPIETAEEHDVMMQGRIDNSERDKLIMQLRGQGLTEEGISQEMLKKFNYKVSSSTCGNVVRRLRGQ
jgi:KaiC/GvpD/RAD55 family RecA-like ATPase